VRPAKAATTKSNGTVPKGANKDSGARARPKIEKITVICERAAGIWQVSVEADRRTASGRSLVAE
jgi:hypothetical protein